METLKEVLMRRDEMTSKEADEIIQEMRNMVMEDGEDPEEVLMNMVGLEPDYIFDILY